MSGGPEAGAILLGLFLIVAGTCFTLVGGGCTVFLLANILDLFRGDYGTGFMLLCVSLVTLAAGILAVRGGLKLMSGGGE